MIVKSKVLWSDDDEEEGRRVPLSLTTFAFASGFQEPGRELHRNHSQGMRTAILVATRS